MFKHVGHRYAWTIVALGTTFALAAAAMAGCDLLGSSPAQLDRVMVIPGEVVDVPPTKADAKARVFEFDERFVNIPFVYWSKSGSHVVAQLWNAQSVPLVAAWEPKTGVVRRLRGYRVVAVEGDRAWVVADSGPWTDDGFDMEYWPHIAGDGIDVLGEDTSIWSLENGRMRPPADMETWATDTGPAGYTAEFVVRKEQGTYPAEMHIISDDGKRRRVEIPSVNTFVPMGWSPSGKYFALHAVPLRTDSVVDVTDADSVVIVSVEDGSSVAFENIGRLPCWDGQRDIMYHVWTGSGAIDCEHLAYLTTDGETGDAWERNGWTPSQRLRNGIDLAGSASSGVVLTSGVGRPAQIWMLDPDSGPVLTADDVDAGAQSRWSQTGGLVVMPFSRSSSEDSIIRVLDVNGRTLGGFSWMDGATP